MARVAVTLPAQEDLREIWAYVAQDDMAAADRLVDRINERCVVYATQPELGTPGDRFAPGLRYLSLGAYVVFYRPETDGILLIRVLHGARNLDEIFGR